jgi:hypothetical protein
VKIDDSIGIADGDVEDSHPRIQSVLRDIVGQRRADFGHRFNRDNPCARVNRRSYPAVGADIDEATRLSNLVENYWNRSFS